jgi:hypothetical protein
MPIHWAPVMNGCGEAARAVVVPRAIEVTSRMRLRARVVERISIPR